VQARAAKNSVELPITKAVRTMRVKLSRYHSTKVLAPG
jgi:hypothetical protein